LFSNAEIGRALMYENNETQKIVWVILALIGLFAVCFVVAGKRNSEEIPTVEAVSKIVTHKWSDTETEMVYIWISDTWKSDVHTVYHVRAEDGAHAKITGNEFQAVEVGQPFASKHWRK
jgi:hypothetical protein